MGHSSNARSRNIRYEVCVFSELRNRLRTGDAWVDRSRQYQDFETHLIPKLTFEMLKAEGPLPVEIETEVQRYLEAGVQR
jgi:hypothetical protein